MLQSDAIRILLLKLTHPDLAELYNPNMEVQVNVAQDGGSRVEGEYKGKYWHGWTDGLTTWKSFRIPWNAATDPKYTPKDIKFDLSQHAEAIGLTGWDWAERLSRWVAFDFDSITGHKAGLTTGELELIQSTASEVPWVTVRQSTGGTGIHFYIHLNPPIPTDNHNEHAALARAVLGQLAAVTGFDFSNKVDVCGGNMWVWHRKMNKNSGLILLKKGDPLNEIPNNWRDHIKVIGGYRRKNLPQTIEDLAKDRTGIDTTFAELTGQYVREALDVDHKKLIDYLKSNGCLWWWDQDNNMLVTHTYHLKEAYQTLNLKGIFDTISGGTERGNDHNCFCFPLRKGGWVIRRFTPGVREHETWDQDGAGWTRSYLNVDPDISMASRNYEGVEHPSGGYVFQEAESAQKAALTLGADLSLPAWALGRTTKLKTHKDGRLIAEIHKENTDNPDKMKGWIPEAGKWKKIFSTFLASPVDSESRNYDDIIRHITTEQHSDCGWVIKADNNWIQEPILHVRYALRSFGLKDSDIAAILGFNIFKKWTIVNKPFQPEYPGDRQWNRDACQLQFTPSKADKLHYPTWSKILSHIGENLTRPLKDEPWAVKNNIETGADYLKCWISSMFQFPEEPLPYIFLFGPEASGKSILHEALSMLVTRSGYQRAENALLSTGGFNSEIKTAILCVIEETNLANKNNSAYTRIKDWVTSSSLPIHPKGGTPYLATNTTHWIQCSNDISFCPVFPGDTRITMVYVDKIPKEEWESKRDLLNRLKKEAPDFLGEIMRLDIPKSTDRLNIPVLATSEKAILQKQNQNALDQFIEEACFHAPGYMIKFSDFYDKFILWLDTGESYNWSKQKVGKSLPIPVVKGRLAGAQFYIGNISFEEPSEKRSPFIVVANNLVSKEALK